MLTIAYEAKRLFNSLTGFGTYCRTLVFDLSTYYAENQYVLYAAERHSELIRTDTFNSEEVKRVIDLDSVSVVYSPCQRRTLWKLFGARADLRSRNVDLYHGLTQQIPYSIRGARIPKILTIHDLIYKYYPEYVPESELEGLDRQINSACKSSDRIIAVSESTKNDLIKWFSVKPEKIVVIYATCDNRFKSRLCGLKLSSVRTKYCLPERYLLYVGSISERKNLLTVLKSLREIPPAERIPLVAIGATTHPYTKYTEVIKKYVDDHKLNDWFLTPKYVVTEDLPAVYQGAELFIYASNYEGFGMPILEALTSGVPVITSNVSAMPEAGGPGAQLVDPNNIEQISRNIMTLTSDRELRTSLIENSRQHLVSFDREKICEQMIDLYKEELVRYNRRIINSRV
jgi:glycosyltransferase involved in cell wall biosynthesis